MNHTANTGAASSDYREYAPPPSLADHLLCFWTLSITGYRSEYAQRVLPDGCIDIVFINDEAPIVVGPWVEPFIARLPVASKIIGARWHPGRAPALLGLPARSWLTNPWRYAMFAVVRSVRHSSEFPSRQISVREDRHLKPRWSTSWRIPHPAIGS